MIIEILAITFSLLKEPKMAPVVEVQALQEAPVPPVEPPFTIERYITQVFGKDARTAIAVAKAESGLDPNNKNKHSTASGVFQITRGTWLDNTDVSWDLRFDAKTNIDTAKKIYDRRQWQPWIVCGTKVKCN